MIVRRILILFLAVSAGVLLMGYRQATADPAVKVATLRLAGWPAGTPAIRAILISDIHVAGPDMPPQRLRRIVAQINALQPDLVLIAGDLVSDKRVSTKHYGIEEAVAPLSGIRAPMGVAAVLGNHDHWRDAAAARRALHAAGVTVLDNRAVRIGPLAVGGIDDDFTGHARLTHTLGELETLPGAKLLLSHSPDPFPEVSDEVGLMLAGHTHCGQIVLPFVGAPATMSRYGDRYACGFVREGRKLLLVTGGVGTSIAPLRFGAPPEIWLLRLGARASEVPGERRRPARVEGGDKAES